MTWSGVYSVVDIVSTCLSLPVAGVGFWVAIKQINKTKAAAEAAHATAVGARADARRAGVLILIPQLQRIEEQIDLAIDRRSDEMLLAWANTWRWQAGQLNQYLQREGVPAPGLPQLLQESVLAAATVKQGLNGKSEAAWNRTTKKLRDSVTSVTNELGGLAVHYSELPNGGEK